MELNDELISELNVALNESSWCYAEAVSDGSVVDLGFQVLTLPVAGPEPDLMARSVRFHLYSVSRIAASLRMGRWDDVDAIVERFALKDLNAVVEGFGGSPIYGWEFIDGPEESWSHWKDRLSLDSVFPGGSDQHVIDLFQESALGPDRRLDVRIWFRDLSVFDYEVNPIPIEDFAAGGRRWWDALYAGDSRAGGHGIVPLKPEKK